MYHLYKKLLTGGAAALLGAALVATPVLAGEWRANSTGFWYVNDDGTYPVFSWQWIDGDNDGVYQCFAFDENGYLILNCTTPDGYLVGASGAWFDGVNAVTRVYPVGTYVEPTPIEGLQKYGYASDGTRLVTNRTGSKTSNKTSTTSKNSASNKTTTRKNNASVISQKNNTNVGNSATVSKKDLVSNKITVGKTDANGSSTSGANASTTTEKTDPSTTAPSTSGFGPSVPTKNNSSSSSSGPHSVITNSDGPKRSGSVEVDGR